MQFTKRKQYVQLRKQMMKKKVLLVSSVFKKEFR
jgi:hypothetical protein